MSKRVLYLFFVLMTIYNIGAEELKPLWQFATGGTLLTSPVITEQGRVYIISEDRYLYALDSQGQELWRYSPKERLSPSLVLTPDYQVIIATESGNVISLNSRGRVNWTYELDQKPLGDPVVSPSSQIIYATEEKHLFALSANGQLNFSISLPAAVSGPLVMDFDGSLYCSLKDNSLLSVNSWGKRRWLKSLPGKGVDMAISEEGILYLALDSGFLCAYGGNGSLIWKNRMTRGSLRQILIQVDGTVLATTQEGRIYWLDPGGFKKQGKKLPWTVSGMGGMADNGEVYLPGGDGFLLALSSKGELSWFYKSDRPFLYAVPTPSGNLYAGGGDWILYAFPASPTTLSSWSNYRNGPDNRGLSRRSGDISYYSKAFEGNMDYLYLKMRLESPGADGKWEVLGYLEKKINEGNIEEYIPYGYILLIRIAQEGLVRPIFMQGQITNDYPLTREKAYRLLGHISSLSAREFLIEAISKEYDTSALAAGIWALGKIGHDFDGASTRAIHFCMKKYPRENALADSAVRSIASIYRFNGGITDPKGLETLSSIFQGAYFPIVRQRALQVIQEIMH